MDTRYAAGHRDGVANLQDEWDFSLDGILPAGVTVSPTTVAAYIVVLQDIVREARDALERAKASGATW